MTSFPKKYAVLFKMIISVFFVTLMTSFSIPAFASDKEQEQTINVGMFLGEGYAEQDEYGHWSGIDIEITENIAQTAGFQVLFVEEQSAKQGLQDLNDGKIDMLADIGKTPEREKNYLFCQYEQGTVGTNIFVREDDNHWDYENIEQLKSMTFSCERDNIAEIDFRNWCSQYGLEPNIVLYDTSAEAEEAVKEGKADGFLDGEDFLKGYRSILSFSPSPYYFVFAKNNTNLKLKVDSALGQIYIENPLYEKELMEKYIGFTQKRNTSFSEEEKKYIAANPTIRVAVLKGDEPYFRGTSAAPAGVIPDFYKQTTSETGLSFVYKIYQTQEEAISAVKSGDADIVGMYSGGTTEAYDQGLIVSKRYTTVNTVMITKTGSDVNSIHRIAVKDRSRNIIIQGLPDNLRNAALIAYNNAEDCFNAFSNKNVDAVIIGLPSATYLVNQRNSSVYDIIPISSVNLELCAAAARKNHTLISILNKGINSESYTMNGIIANNTAAKNNLKTTIARIPSNAIIIFSCVMILLVLILCWAVLALIKSRKTKVAAIEAEAAAEEQRIKAEASEKSAQEKNAFFANISHDMRTPLNGILGFAELAEKQDSLDKAKAYIAKVKISGNLLRDLINDTLTISKIGSGKLELKPEPVDTSTLTEEITGSIDSLASQKNVDFIVDDGDMRRRTVLADKLNIEKIFLNLLSNAVRFTPKGGHVRFTLKDEPKDSDDPDIIAIVQDDGIGMSDEYLQRMYEPFSQEKRQGYESVGTGLGLSIVKHLVEIMGGTIEVQSELGKGTAFKVRIHLKEVPSSDAKETVTENKENLTLLEGKNILLCEDNALNREIAIELLKDRKITVVTAENGEIGLELFTQSDPNKFAAILMDIRMPVMDGLTAAKKIRALDRPDAKVIPIIAMTADAFEENLQEAKVCGMNGYITKPIETKKLYAELLRLIR